MEKYAIDILAGVAIMLIGAGVLAIVKAQLNSLKFELLSIFVSRETCELVQEKSAEERESMRKDIQNHEERLNSVGAP
jgi:hypothetical protein